MRVSSPETAHATAADQRACRTSICMGSRSFFAASKLLPRAVREPAYGLYAFCRLSDDAVDETGSPSCRLAASDSLGRRLSLAYAGNPADCPADRAFADVVLRHAIPEALPRALMEGLGWDARGRRYATLSELSDYASRVAGSVGAMMTLIMGVRDPAILARACDLGVAMQFTNIARDVGEDARAGRLYLPLDWLAEAGIDAEDFLAAPQVSPALRAIVGRLLDEAEILYERSEAGIAGLPPACRPAIRSARAIYAEIGREIEANGLDSVGRRARVPGFRKAVLVARTFRPAVAAVVDAAPLPETAHLIEAVRRCSLPIGPASRSLPAWWDIPGQIAHVLDLIEQLEERDASRFSGPPPILHGQPGFAYRNP